MPANSLIDDSKKLGITYRVEGGCLGPAGLAHIEKFCQYAQKTVKTNSQNVINLTITPRHDKKLPEMQFSVLSKRLTHTQAKKYLNHIGENLEEIEYELSDELTRLIENYAKKFIC